MIIGSSISHDPALDRRKRGQAIQLGYGMMKRFATAQSTVAMRRWGLPAMVALLAVTALTAGAEAKQARPARITEATAARETGEPIMAIVSIKSQKVTFY